MHALTYAGSYAGPALMQLGSTECSTRISIAAFPPSRKRTLNGKSGPHSGPSRQNTWVI